MINQIEVAKMLITLISLVVSLLALWVSVDTFLTFHPAAKQLRLRKAAGRRRKEFARVQNTCNRISNILRKRRAHVVIRPIEEGSKIDAAGLVTFSIFFSGKIEMYVNPSRDEFFLNDSPACMRELMEKIDELFPPQPWHEEQGMTDVRATTLVVLLILLILVVSFFFRGIVNTEKIPSSDIQWFARTPSPQEIEEICFRYIEDGRTNPYTRRWIVVYRGKGWVREYGLLLNIIHPFEPTRDYTHFRDGGGNSGPVFGCSYYIYQEKRDTCSWLQEHSKEVLRTLYYW